MNELNFRFKKTLPMIYQGEHSECGLACIAMISAYHEGQIDLFQLRRSYKIGAKGLDLGQIVEIFDSLHFDSRPVKLDKLSIRHLQLPAIIHWGMDHFVVLKSINKRFFNIHDPSSGCRQVSKEHFFKKFTGIALEVTPSKSFEKSVAKKSIGFKNLWSKTSGLTKALSLTVAASLITHLLSLGLPFYLQITVDSVLPSSNLTLLNFILLGFLFIVLIHSLLTAIRDLTILRMSTQLDLQISNNIFNHLIRLRYRFFEPRSTGDILTRFSSIDQIRDIISNSVTASVIDGFMASITLLIMLNYSVSITFTSLAFVALYTFIKYLTKGGLERALEKTISSTSHKQTFFLETIRAIQLIKINQMEIKRIVSWKNKLTNFLNAQTNLRNYEVLHLTLNTLIFGVERLVIVYISAIATINGNLSLGMFLAFLAFKESFLSSVRNFVDNIFKVKLVRLHLDRISDIVLEEQDPTLKNIETEMNTVTNGCIRVEQLSFSYSSSESPIFSDLSFSLPNGKSLAIVGPSGSGKTTLLMCLLNLLEPSSGEIYIDGSAIQTIGNYGKSVSAVMQDDKLLTGTIADNIACFDEKIDYDRVVECARLAMIDAHISSLPMRYSTWISDMGNNMSGGQIQRIVIARALYRNPKILFLDEATSHLDTETEILVNKNISNLNITRVIIAHRKETIESADFTLNLSSSQKG